MRTARVGNNSLFSREVLYSLILTNVLSLIFGAGFGWVSYINYFIKVFYSFVYWIFNRILFKTTIICIGIRPYNIMSFFVINYSRPYAKWSYLQKNIIELVIYLIIKNKLITALHICICEYEIKLIHTSKLY